MLFILLRVVRIHHVAPGAHGDSQSESISEAFWERCGAPCCL